MPQDVVAAHTQAIRRNVKSGQELNAAIAKAKADDKNIQSLVNSISDHQRKALSQLAGRKCR